MASKTKNWVENPTELVVDFDAAKANRERIEGEQAKPPSKQAGLPTRAEELRAFYRTPHWRKARYRALKKAGGRCQCCGARPTLEVCLHVDHIKPKSKYPELALRQSNLQVLCEDCNQGKGSWDETDWRKL